MGKDLVVHIEIPFAFDQDRPGGRVKIIDGRDDAEAQGLLEPQKGRGGDGKTPFTQGIKEFDKQIRFLSAHPHHLLGGSYQISALLEEDAQVGDVPPGKGFHLEIRIRLQGANPVDQFPCRRFLLDTPEIPQAIEGLDAGVGQLLVQIGKMHVHNEPHHSDIGKGNVMEIAAAQEGIGEVFLGVGCNDDHRPVAGGDGLVDLDDIELHLIENIEHVILKIAVGLVDFIDQQHRSHLRHKGLADFPHADVFFDVAHIPSGIPEAAVVEARQGIVLIQGVHELHAGLHVQHDQRHLQAFGNGMGKHRLACARFSLEQEGHFQGHGDIDDLCQFVIKNVFRTPAKRTVFLTHKKLLL